MARAIEYVTAEGEVIFTMDPWQMGSVEREASADEAQMFYDEGSVHEANGAWLIVGWRYEGEREIRPLELQRIEPPSADEIIDAMSRIYQERRKYLSYPRRMVLAARVMRAWSGALFSEQINRPKGARKIDLNQPNWMEDLERRIKNGEID